MLADLKVVDRDLDAGRKIDLSMIIRIPVE